MLNMLGKFMRDIHNMASNDLLPPSQMITVRWNMHMRTLPLSLTNLWLSFLIRFGECMFINSGHSLTQAED